MQRVCRGVFGGGTWRGMQRGYTEGYMEGNMEGLHGGVHGGVYRGSMQPGNIEGASLLSIVTIGCP